MSKTVQHWYDVSQEGVVTSRYGSGMKEARVHNYYASVTTIEKEVRATPYQLKLWIEKQVILACINNPMGHLETVEDYAVRVQTYAGMISGIASDFGTRTHDAIEHYPAMPTDEQVLPFYKAFTPWVEKNVTRIIDTEVMVANTRIGLAGKLDALIMHKTHGLTLVDYKTQGIKSKASFYSSFCRQLAFYAYSLMDQRKLPELPRILSVVINSLCPSPPEEKLWTWEEQETGWKEMVAQAWLYSQDKDHWPAGKWEMVDVLKETTACPKWS